MVYNGRDSLHLLSRGIVRVSFGYCFLFVLGLVLFCGFGVAWLVVLHIWVSCLFLPIVLFASYRFLYIVLFYFWIPVSFVCLVFGVFTASHMYAVYMPHLTDNVWHSSRWYCVTYVILYII